MLEIDENLIYFIEADFKHVKIHASMPHPLKEEELKNFNAQQRSSLQRITFYSQRKKFSLVRKNNK